MWDQVRLFLRNRLLDLLGLTLLAASGAALLALFSYHPSDPSLNTAAPGEPKNWLGEDGAIFADLGLQLFGLGILAIVIPVGVFGVWCLRKTHPPFLWIRGLFWILGILSASALAHHLSYVLESLTEKVTASIPAGWGGVVGSTLADGISQSLILLKVVSEGTAQLASGGGFLALLLIGLTFALGLRFRHIRETYASMRSGIAYAGTAVGNAARFAGRLTPGEPQFARAADGVRGRSALKEAADSTGAGDKTPPRIKIEPAVPRDTPQSRAEARAEERARARAEKERKRQEREERAARDSAVKAAAASVEIRGLAVEPPNFTVPPLNLLARPSVRDRTERVADRVLEERARKLEGVLQDFGVNGQILNVRPGPVITLYEFEPAPGIKSSRVIGLADDIARSMSAVSARVAVIPGRNAMGIELPNKKRETVYLRELLASEDFENDRGRLNLALGKTIGGEPVIGDLSEMPHLLIAGTTGSGKSVAINTMILSLLYKLTPAQCRLILIDPKMLELSVYDGIPHLLTPVVTEPKKAVVALKWIVREMEDRYRMMSKLGVRNIHGYNEKVSEALAKGQKLTRRVQTGFDKKGAPKYEREQFAPEPMPFIVVVVDEMADLMMVAGKDIEGAVQRLAQMARAAGIHLITATQRPSVDVITGTIKANFPTRISFQVTSKIDSRTILGEQGAEHLLGKGDMLYMPGGGRISRLHGPFVTDDEVEAVVANLKKQGAPEYVAEVTEEPAEDPLADLLGGSNGPGDDDLYDKAVAIVARDRKASTSYIQRKLQIGYNRAARIVDRMEEEGVVSQPNHAGKREVLVGDHGFE